MAHSHQIDKLLLGQPLDRCLDCKGIMLTDDVTNVPAGEEWRPKAATPPAARSEIATTADHRKVRHGSLPFVSKARILQVMKRANLNLFRLQSESIRPDGLSHLAARYEVNLRLIEQSRAVGESLRARRDPLQKQSFKARV
jgi:hypothetical protein